ncbi:unnamed protein product, partial [Mycena citricolor]
HAGSGSNVLGIKNALKDRGPCTHISSVHRPFVLQFLSMHPQSNFPSTNEETSATRNPKACQNCRARKIKCLPTDACRAWPCERCTRKKFECRYESIQGNVSALQTIPDGKNTIQFDTTAPPRRESNVASTRPPGRSRATEQCDVHNQPGSYAGADPHGVYGAQHAAYNGRAGPSGPMAGVTQSRWPVQGNTNPQAARYPVYAEHAGQDHHTQMGGHLAPRQYATPGQGYHDGHVAYPTSASYWQPAQGQQQQQQQNGGDSAYSYKR